MIGAVWDAGSALTCSDVPEMVADQHRDASSRVARYTRCDRDQTCADEARFSHVRGLNRGITVQSGSESRR